jgi:hypothetical protein
MVWNENYDELYDLVYTAWHHSYGETTFFDFDKVFLEWFLKSPQTPKDYIFSQYDQVRLVGFAACSHRSYWHHHRVVDGAFGTFLSIHPDYAKRRLAYKLVKELVLKLKLDYQKHGRPAFLSFFLDDDQGMSRLVKTVGVKTNTVVQKISRVDLKVKVLCMEKVLQISDLKFYERWLLGLKSSVGTVRKDFRESFEPFVDTDIDFCLALANDHANQTGFRPHWDRDTLSRQLRFPPLTSTLVFRKQGHIQGYINYRIVSLIGKNNMHKIALVDWVSDQKMNPQEKTQFVRQFLLNVREAGCVMAMFTDTPFLNDSCLRYGGFLSYPRKVSLTCFNFDPGQICLDHVQNSYELLY